MSEPSPMNPSAESPVTRSLQHELRTPLNHIIGYCEMLTEEAQDCGFQSVLPDLEHIHKAGLALLSAVNELCDPVRLPVYQANPGLLDHDMRTPLNQIIGYAEMLQDELRPGGHGAFIGDLGRICSAARELLRRVVEHFSPDPAAIAAANTSTAAESATVVFHRQRAAPLIALPPAPMGRLLVADDDEANRTMLARRLRRSGHEVTLASSGHEALAQLRLGAFDLLLLDIQMSGMNGYQVLEAMKGDAALMQIPVIVLSASDETARIARCIEMGAEDYLSKPFDPVLLRARIHACLEKRQLRERERRAFEALRQSQQELSHQLAEAADYVRSLLSPPLITGPVRADWRFLPCSELGGDSFGYHWLDERRLAFFLLDVCGHGVGAALLSVSVLNTLLNRSIPGVDFGDPGAVLAALNRTFTMERQNNMFFTIWYGVLATDLRELRFACGGHPPAVALQGGVEGAQELRASGAIVGGFPEAEYPTEHHVLAPGSRLYLFSDGIYELARPHGETVQIGEFIGELARPSPGSKLDALMAWAGAIRTGARFEDDVSILELQIP